VRRPLVVSALVLTVAAALVAVATARGSASPLETTFDSPSALAVAVLDAVQRGDREALGRFALSDQEFRRHVWPSLPAARPGRNLTVDYVWSDLAGKSRAYLAASLSRALPAGARVKGVGFDGQTTVYGTFAVHRRSRIVLVDRDGLVSTVRLFGSAIEMDGRYKVFSYVTD
jgi:hypothetical protein